MTTYHTKENFFTMKKILVPIDFSSFSMHAAEVAAAIARKTDARIYFLHVIDLPVYGGDTPFQDRQSMAENLFILKHVKMQFKALFEQPFLQGVNAAEVLQFDGIYDTITEHAAQNEMDLIVMGTHGSSGFVNDLFVGTNTEKVVRLADMPVLAIKHKMNLVAFENIVFASNFFAENDQAFAQVKFIADLFGAKLHLLKVVTRNDFETTDKSYLMMDEFAEKNGLSVYTKNVYNANTAEEGILAFANRCKADMIALATHGRTGLAHLINGSLAEDVVNHAALPILSVKIKKQETKTGVIFP